MCTQSQEATGMLIRVSIERRQPLAGTASTEQGNPVRFEGWLELLRVLAELVAAAAPSAGRDVEAGGKPMEGNETGRRH